MLGKISLSVFTLALLVVETALFGSGGLAVLSMPLVLTVSTMLILPKTSPWWFLVFGIISDLLLFRPVGFTPIIILFVIAVFNALRAVFTITDFWGNLITAMIVIILGGICENILFQMIGVEAGAFSGIIWFSLVNILGMAVCSFGIYLIRLVTHLDAEV